MPDIQAGCRKERCIQDLIVNIHWIVECLKNIKRRLVQAFKTQLNLWKWIMEGMGFSKMNGCASALDNSDLYWGQEANG